MKKIFTALMLVASVFTISARELHADLSKAEAKGSNVESWDATTGTFAWKGNNDARILITDIVGDGDFSAWDSLVIVSEDLKESASFRLDIKLKNGTELKGDKDNGRAFWSAGVKKIALADVLAEGDTVQEIRINTNSNVGSVVLKDLYLLNDEAEPQYFEKVCQGFKAVKNNNQCSYDTITNTFAWTASNANTMRIFKLNAGNFAAYQTMELTTSDFQSENEVGANDLKYRVLFMGENDTKIKEKSFASVGKKTINIADLELAEDQIAAVVEIRFAGACAQGSLVVVPSDIRLIGEGEEAPVDDPDEEIEDAIYDVHSDVQSVKAIENGRMIIIRNGVRFDLTGKVVNSGERL